MRCTNCGASVPFAGNVCPRCHSSKAGSQVAALLLLPVGLVAAAIVGAATASWTWAIVAFFLGGAIPGVIAQAEHKKRNRRRDLED
jgi:hypothetical protein